MGLGLRVAGVDRTVPGAGRAVAVQKEAAHSLLSAC